jgi:hypothetical protein
MKSLSDSQLTLIGGERPSGQKGVPTRLYLGHNSGYRDISAQFEDKFSSASSGGHGIALIFGACNAAGSR